MIKILRKECEKWSSCPPGREAGYMALPSSAYGRYCTYIHVASHHYLPMCDYKGRTIRFSCREGVGSFVRGWFFFFPSLNRGWIFFVTFAGVIFFLKISKKFPPWRQRWFFFSPPDRGDFFFILMAGVIFFSRNFLPPWKSNGASLTYHVTSTHLSHDSNPTLDQTWQNLP